MAIAAVATATMALAARPASNLFLTSHRARWVFTLFAVSSSSSSKPSRALILYSKSGCCLCDGLKEKLQAAFLLSGSDSLHDVDLQVRDITSNPEWERAYQYEIPVLARVLSDDTEITFVVSSDENIIFLFRKLYPDYLLALEWSWFRRKSLLLSNISGFGSPFVKVKLFFIGMYIFDPL